MRWLEPPHVETPGYPPDLHPLARRILNRKGFPTKEALDAFLNPDFYKPAPGTDISGLASAADRIETAIKRQEAICVWGDFDADGQTATTVLVQTLHALGAQVTYHIPVRAVESHGVNIPNLAKVIDQGAQLIVTCDTGISAHDAVEYARSRKVDFIVTDHHDLPESLPNAYALVDPKMLPPEHPLANLAGVGVAYKLAEELLSRRNGSLLPSELLDLVALGMVADLAILTLDSRYLVQKGLEQIRKTDRLGLKVMMELSDRSSAAITEGDIGFALGPRLNALGRLADANPAVELLTTSDPIRARVLATQLEGLNIQRKMLCDQVFKAAEAQLHENPSLLDEPILVLAHPKWPGGVIGIAASKLVARYGKPAILFSSPDGEPARGSARSIDGINITEAITRQKDILLGFGGHPMAAGLSLESEKLPEFRRRISKVVQSALEEKGYEEEIVLIDGWISLPEADLQLAEGFEKLSPFGPGNRKPILAFQNVEIKEKAVIGKNKDHLKLIVEDESVNQSEVLWWDGAAEELPEGRFDLAVSLRASNWQGIRRAQLEWFDFRPSETRSIEISPSKVEFVDCRSIENKLEMLESLQKDAQIWAEGPDKRQANGKDRLSVSSAKNLVMWTTPPSSSVFRKVLEESRAEKVYLFAVDPDMDEMNDFLDRLAGLCKYAINHKNGITTIPELAAACAQTDSAVESGLNWLALNGKVIVEYLTEDQVQIADPKTKAASHKNLPEPNEIELLLRESSAYRRYFSSVDIASLLPQK